MQEVRIYLVGGAVRDRLLHLPVQDKDYVVVGANAAYMKAQGFLEVGKDFPVFLHPQTKEEYALARQERKVAKGYAGFEFYADETVSLEEDLRRRDLTINAMAEDENGNIIDPFNGQDDLKSGILRHVSEAFVEDPVRILRVARLAARYRFSVAKETLELMKEMVQNGEVAALVPERIWQEVYKGLQENQPSIMFQVLQDCGALAIIFPELHALYLSAKKHNAQSEEKSFKQIMQALDDASKQNFSLEVRYALLCLAFIKAMKSSSDSTKEDLQVMKAESVKAFNLRYKVPAKYAQLAMIVCQEYLNIHQIFSLESREQLDLLLRVDALRRPDRFVDVLNACLSDAKGDLDLATWDYPQHAYCLGLLDVIGQMDVKTLLKGLAPEEIAARIYQERLRLTKGYQEGHQKRTEI